MGDHKPKDLWALRSAGSWLLKAGAPARGLPSALVPFVLGALLLVAFLAQKKLLGPMDTGASGGEAVSRTTLRMSVSPDAPVDLSAAGGRGAGARSSSEAGKGRVSHAECDLFHGQWVRDEAYPLYTNATCKIISEHQNCQGNGRPDREYEQWRWEPHGCALPRFDAKAFFKAFRGKNILFVGDSVARNHLESLVCLLDQEEEHTFTGSRHRLNYNYRKNKVQVSRVWSSWMVEEGVGTIDGVEKENATLIHLDRPGEVWMEDARKADLLVLSSGHWFVKPTVYMLDGKPVGTQMLRTSNKSLKLKNVEAFKIALDTTLQALQKDKEFKGVFMFRAYSPEHYEGGKWDTGGSCAGKTEPRPSNYTWRNDFGEAMYQHQRDSFETVFSGLGRTQQQRFVFLDVMPMAALRVDGHPGPYRGKQSLAQMEKNKNSKFPPPQDCLHWCLPGPMDNWNELLLPLYQRAVA